ncbi:hypothetical protein XAP412_510038 [Xanthomonas phaseoli pv. phaseoli]|uniref:Secreted protein n=1 Tax=Xanthomonas campestris pv. phaseoli TaxID=317013 RepID=A0AB38E274_XANCH|nr:hypothetical protein XAP6984_560037 [Xanthomonas phaseoli pv. phaseoli]SON86980.1 hypothetical protein XAP412_510038 [Xanthomonas phaseoli pv. phaseoli]SON90990.1 hypothetical protein XAP7430_520037 [Xanthomonas phaseoli pv. phaseoli]SOO28417.1 hypothetical protein XAP6164_2400004 [Xanthomonas phaseoli pv. phaseoli]
MNAVFAVPLQSFSHLAQPDVSRAFHNGAQRSAPSLTACVLSCLHRCRDIRRNDGRCRVTLPRYGVRALLRRNPCPMSVASATQQGKMGRPHAGPATPFAPYR